MTLLGAARVPPLVARLNGGVGFACQLKGRPLLLVKGAYDVMYPLLPPERRGIAALPLSGAVVTADLVDTPLKPLTGPVQPYAQVKPVPILAHSGW